MKKYYYNSYRGFAVVNHLDKVCLDDVVDKE